jgi:hypothetical protein
MPAANSSKTISIVVGIGFLWSSSVRPAMRLGFSPLIFSLFPVLVLAQEATNASYVTSTGERVLCIESTLPLEKRDAWKLFTTVEGLEKWIAPVVAIDFRVGGEILTNYDKTKSVRDHGTIRLPILNYLDGEMITLKVKLNDKFPAKVRREDGNLQEIIQLQDIGAGKTLIRSSMIGWGVGPEWDKAYAFFAAGNKWTYQQLVANFRQ